MVRKNSESAQETTPDLMSSDSASADDGSHDSESDVGLFGPDSMVWFIHRQPAMLLGGLRALLLQALHPLAMAGVRDHSDYKADPWSRYGRTRDYIVSTSFGTTATAQRLADSVVRIHNYVHGTDVITGKPYDANDPDLLLWVHNCLVDSFLASHLAYVGDLTDEQIAQYLTEMTRASELLGLPADRCAQTRGELAQYFAEMQSTLCVGQAVREAAHVVLSPPLFLLAKPGWWIFSVGAVDLLPSWAAQMYGWSLLKKSAFAMRFPNRLVQRVGKALLGEAPEVLEAYQRARVDSGWQPGWAYRCSGLLRKKIN